MHDRRPVGPPNPGNGKTVHAGCGAIFGIFVAIGATHMFSGSIGRTIGIALTSSIVCALLAYRFGDRFWESTFWRRWFW